MLKFTIPGQLAGLNEYTKACRGNKYAAATMKSQAEHTVMGAIKRGTRGKKMDVPVYVKFRWIEPNNRRDLDNIAFAKKFILDALVKMGVLENDDRRHVVGFEDEFPPPDKMNPRVEVELHAQPGVTVRIGHG